jgi:hypothetical protein
MDSFLEYMPPVMVDSVAQSINRVYLSGGHLALMLSQDEIIRRREKAERRIENIRASGAPLPPAPPPSERPAVGWMPRIIDGGRSHGRH